MEETIKFQQLVPKWREENPVEDMELKTLKPGTLEDEVTRYQISACRKESNRDMELEYALSGKSRQKIISKLKSITVDETIVEGLSHSEPSSSKEIFAKAIDKLEKDQKKELTNRLNFFMGTGNLSVEMLPETLANLQYTFRAYRFEHKQNGFIDFEKVDKRLLVPHSELSRIFNKEMYAFYEQAFLSDQEFREIEKIIPSPGKRQEMFLEYLKGKPIHIGEKNSREKVRSFFGKIIQAISRLFANRNKLDETFNKLKTNISRKSVSTSQITQKDIHDFRKTHKRHEDWVKSLDRNTLETIVAVQRMRKTSRLSSRFTLSKMEKIIQRFPDAVNNLQERLNKISRSLNRSMSEAQTIKI